MKRPKIHISGFCALWVEYDRERWIICSKRGVEGWRVGARLSVKDCAWLKVLMINIEVKYQMKRGSVGYGWYWKWMVRRIKGYRIGVRDDFQIIVVEDWYGERLYSRIRGWKFLVLCFIISNIHCQFNYMILTRSIYSTAHSININYISGL